MREVKVCTCDPRESSRYGVLLCNPLKCGKCHDYMDAKYVEWLNANRT